MLPENVQLVTDAPLIFNRDTTESAVGVHVVSVQFFAVNVPGDRVV